MKYPPQRKSVKVGGKTLTFRSGMEERVAKELHSLKEPVNYERDRIPYTQPSVVRTYTPDFTLDDRGPTGSIYCELKGLFSSADRKKHLLIKKEYGDKVDIRFVFYNPTAKLSKKSKTRYCDWCDKHGFKWAAHSIPMAWLSERTSRGDL